MKKFLIILLAFFLLIPKTFALTNYDTTYNITIPEYPFFDWDYGDTTLKDFFDDIKSIETSKYFFVTLTFSYSNSTYHVSALNYYVFDSIPLVSFRTLTNSSSKYFYYMQSFNWGSTPYMYYMAYSVSDLSSLYNTLYSCLHDNDCSSFTSKNTTFESSEQLVTSEVYTNSESYNITLPINTYAFNRLPIYSNFGLVYEQPSTDSSNSRFYKNVTINNTPLVDGGYFPTYYDLYYSSSPDPDEPVDPDDPDEPVNPDDPDEPTSSDFTSWIYWFSEPSDSTSVLNNIYTLLFLYCVSMLILKTYYIIKDKK